MKLASSACLAIVLLVLGCKPVCQPGATQECKCPPDHSGVQSCNEEGSAWLACNCGLGEAMAEERLREKIELGPGEPDKPAPEPSSAKLEVYREKLLTFLRNAEVRDRQLEDGSWKGKKEDFDEEIEGQPVEIPEAKLIEDLVSFGDLNGDGVDEIASIVDESGGGTAVDRDLVVAGNIDGSLAVLATILFHDRTEVKKVEIKDGLIHLDLVEHSDDDPDCCPSVPTKRQYELKGSELELVERTHEGDTAPMSLE